MMTIGITKREAVMALAILLLGIGLAFSFVKMSRMSREADHNIAAMTDSLHHYKTKYGDEYFAKTILEGDLKLLKQVNDSIYKEVEKMKIKNPQTVVYVETITETAKHDTVWQLPPDLLLKDARLVKDFSFSDKWHLLDGTIKLENSDMKLDVNNNKVFASFVVAVENGRAYLKTDNPYIKIDDITGIAVPQRKEKVKRLGLTIGPAASVGYSFNSKKIEPYVGISLVFGYDLTKR